MEQISNSKTETAVVNRNDPMVLKKAFVFLIVSLLTLSVSHAQRIFVGGNIGLNYSGGQSTYNGNTNDEPLNFNIRLAPMLGYYIKDDLAVGLRVKLGYLMTEQNSSEDVEQAYCGVSVFSRYNVWRLGNFTLSLEGSAGVVGVNTSTTSTWGLTDDSRGASFSIDVVPLLSYSLTDRVSIESQFNFLNLGFSSSTSHDVSNPSNKTTHNHFNLGVNNSWEPFNWTVGLVYKFKHK